MGTQQPVIILLVEDDPGHALLIEKNLRRAGVSNEIAVLDNGQKAVDYLLKEGAYKESPHPLPPLILLDLNLPLLDGYQVLKIIKNDERTKKFPSSCSRRPIIPTKFPGVMSSDAMSILPNRWNTISSPTRSGRSGCSSRS